MAKDIITALELTETHIKMAQAKKHFNSMIVHKLLVRELTNNSDTEIVKAMRSLLSESRLKTSNLIVSLPRDLVTVRTLKLPSNIPQEIEKMVEFQLTKQIPYPKEELVLDYKIVDTDPQGYSQVLMVIILKEVVERFLKIFKELNLRPDILTFSSQGLVNWYTFYERQNKIASKDIIVLLDMDTTLSDVCFYSQENLIFGRSIPLGSKDFKPDKLESFLGQFRLTLSTYQKEGIIPSISKIIITKELENMDEFVNKLKQEFSCAVEIVSLLKDIPKEKGVETFFQLKSKDISYTAILGLVLGSQKDLFNLLPAKVIEEHKTLAKKQEFIYIVGFVFLLAGLGLLTFIVKTYSKNRYLTRLTTMLNETAPQVENVEMTLKKLDLVNQRFNKSISSIDIISELSKILPSSISLTVYSLDEANTLTLQGVSLAMSDVFNFQSMLEKTGHFKNVEVKYASKRKTKTGEVTDFRMVCQVVEKNLL